MMILVCEEFPSHPGGVGYFSDVLAKKFYKQHQLKGVISLSPFQVETRDFEVLHMKLPTRNYGKWPFDGIVLFRKINSLCFRILSRIQLAFRHPVIKALDSLYYKPNEDILFFTYQVHHPELIPELYKHYNGPYHILYHGLDFMGFRDHPKQINRIAEKATITYFNSKATQQYFGELGFRSGKQEILYPELDTDYIESHELYNVSELEDKLNIKLAGYTLISCICRLVKRKGLHFAIEIVEQLEKQEPGNFKYIVGGNGPEMGALQQLVAEKGLEEVVYFPGFVDDMTKYSLLKASKVFLMPNYDYGGNDFEGFGISFLEAGYFDNLVIGGSHGGAVEALEMVSNGFPFSFPQEKELVIKKLKTILS